MNLLKARMMVILMVVMVVTACSPQHVPQPSYKESVGFMLQM